VPVNVLNKIASGILISVLTFLRRHPFRRVLVSVLLVSVLIPLLASAQSASSQTFETRTTLLTATSFGFTAATTSYRTSTVTLEALTQLSGMVNVGPAVGGTGCNYNRLTYTVKDPGDVFGHFNASSAIRFYFLTDALFLKYIPVGYPGISCTIPRSDTVVSVEDALSYSFEVYVSKAGLYDFAFLNLSPTQPVTVNFSANTGQAATTTTTFAMVSYSTITQPFVLTSTQTLGSISPQAGPVFAIGNFGTVGAIAMVAIIVMVGSVLVLVRKRKASMNAVTATAEKSAQRTKPAEQVPPPPVSDRLSTGYDDLDGLLLGGLPKRFAVLLLSPPCDERDLLLQKIIGSALSAGMPTFCLSNDPSRIQDMVSTHWKDFYALSPQADKISSPPANLYKIPAIDNLSDFNIAFTKIMEMHVKERTGNRLLIVDLLTDILLHHKGLTSRKWFSDFLARRKAEGFTVLAFLNPLVASNEETQTLIDLFDGVIEIYEKELRQRPRRFLVIKRMHGHRYSDSELMLDKDKLFSSPLV
jgi:KaiC/GvpD/RAD55 family RecA-like ATPase